MTCEPAVLIRDLAFRYPRTVSGRSVQALRGISLRVDPGEIVAITGPSGSGKSTLCRCFNGLVPHATKGVMDGEVIIRGMNTRDHDIPEFASRVGLVFQDPEYQLVSGDVTSEIAFGLEALGRSPEAIDREIERCAGVLPIRHLLGRQIADLSWGERQRVAIASVIAMHPPVIVLDEPFSGIDASAGQVLCGAVRKLREESGTTVIFFEHRLSLLRGLADRLVMLDGGKIVSDGPFPTGLTAPGPETGMCRALVGGGSPSLASPGVSGREDRVPAPGRIAALSFRRVRFRYPGSAGMALDDITLDFYPGEIAVLAGQNGSGKTTLLKLMNGLLHPDAGEVLVQGLPAGDRTVAALSRTVGLLCQHADFQLFESTIADELAFAPGNIGVSREEIARRTGSVLTECVLGHIDPATPPLGLSGGEKQRVAIAGLFMMDTPVVVLDEPTFGLDNRLKTALAAALKRMRDRGKAVIIATHDGEFAGRCADRIIGIAAGRIVQDYRVTCRDDPSGDHPGPEPCGEPGQVPPGDARAGRSVG
jgi:energy-coupling factor transport system ATP-binding protein